MLSNIFRLGAPLQGNVPLSEGSLHVEGLALPKSVESGNFSLNSLVIRWISAKRLPAQFYVKTTSCVADARKRERVNMSTEQSLPSPLPPLVLIVYFLIEGVASIMFALEHKRELSGRWGWMLASGIIDLIMAAIIFAGLPGTAVWAIGMLVGINMVFGGSALIAMALHAREIDPRSATPAH
jgi:Short repeat of unknown function (DUF308)